MKVFKVWEDFESESMNETDLLQFAIGLWKDGALKIEQMLIDNKKVTRYSLKYYQDEER
jgi:hypothetical protein